MTIEFNFKDIEHEQGTHNNGGITITTLADGWYHVQIDIDKIEKEVTKEDDD